MSQERRTYDFSSVGLSANSARQSQQLVAREQLPPIGPVTPLRFEDGRMVMHKDLKSQIRDNFRNMIKTNWGERVALTDFGANLSPLIFELGAENVDHEAIARIRKTTKKYMPYIKLITFEATSAQVDSTDAAVIKIVYSIDGVTSEHIEEVVEILGS